MARFAKLLTIVIATGCVPEVDPRETPDVPDAGVPAADASGAAKTDDCPAMFAQDILPAYHIEISASDWAAMQDEFLHRPEREAAGMEVKPYHPVGFRYEVEGSQPLERSNVLFRLKGESSWLQTIAFDADPKMQFVIAFNEIDPDGRFLGVRKVELDMPRGDHTFLRQRLGLYGLRQMGIPAQCANNARLFINGKYYGLYTNLERLDKEFIQRNFDDEDDGDLWEGGRIIRTNEDTFSWDHLELLWHGVFDVAALEAITDLDASLLEWAAEAVIGDADGYYNGRANFYIYDHPTRGFIWLPDDLDTTLDPDFLPVDTTPVFPAAITPRYERDWTHYLLVLNDPGGLVRYIGALAQAFSRYDVADMQARVDAWSSQIATAAAADPHKPFAMDAHRFAVAQTHDYIAGRAAYIGRWLTCREFGGDDRDGDGFDFCQDCDDGDPEIAPGAPERCNGEDDDCDGRVDDLPAGQRCP